MQTFLLLLNTHTLSGKWVIKLSWGIPKFNGVLPWGLNPICSNFHGVLSWGQKMGSVRGVWSPNELKMNRNSGQSGHCF